MSSTLLPGGLVARRFLLGTYSGNPKGKLLLAATALLPFAAHAKGVTPYVGNASPTYNCVAGDNSSAINGLLANGGPVNLAAGTCNITKGLVMTVTGTTLNGAGMGQTILQVAKPATIDAVTMGVSRNNYRANNMTVGNLTIDGATHTPELNASKIGRGVVIAGGVTQSFVTNVEARFGVDGVFVVGSFNTINGVWVHDNRHAGIYVAGNSNMPPPYNFADHDTTISSRIDNNALDNAYCGASCNPNQWDGLDYDKFSSNGTIGGITPALGNEVTGNDILIACSNCTASQPISTFTVQSNTVSNSTESGIRTGNEVADITIMGNTVSGCGMGINIIGGVHRATVSNNTITGATSQGVGVYPNSGQPTGDTVTVDSNDITMTSTNRDAVRVTKDTNVHVTNNAMHGAVIDTAPAGAGLVVSGNY